MNELYSSESRPVDFSYPQNQSLHLLLSEELSKPDFKEVCEESKENISRLRVEKVANQRERAEFSRHFFVQKHLERLRKQA